jgi:hypothetical protein
MGQTGKKELSSAAKAKVAASLTKIRAAQAKLAADAAALEAKVEAVGVTVPAEKTAPEAVIVKAEKKPRKAGKRRSAPKAVKEAKAAKAPKAKKAAKEPKVKKAPQSGQSGPALDGLEYDKLNANEKKLVDKLAAESAESNATLAIEELAKVFARSASDSKQANSWTRNALRRLVRGNFVTKVERGSYKLTRRGANQAA